MISNEPEHLKNSSACTGDNDLKFLCRGRIKGRARVYFEHINEYGKNMRFGVLLWNKGKTPVTVTLASRSVKYGLMTTSAFQTAVQGVWTDNFNLVKQTDDSDLKSTVTLPAYSSSAPGNSAKWVALSTIPSGTENAPMLFNGLLSLSLTDGAGNVYEGNDVYCDTYVMNSETYIKAGILNMSLAPRAKDTSGSFIGENIRGSGTGAVLFTNISGTKTITSSDPYRMLIAGHVLPWLQSGERIVLSTYSATGTATVQLNNALNYAVLYRFVFPNGFAGNGTIKAKVKANPKTNPGIAAYPDSGVYVAGYWGNGESKFNGLARSGSDLIINSNVPKNQQVILNIVACGMGVLPIEISFEV